jgi:hypothetical protein
MLGCDKAMAAGAAFSHWPHLSKLMPWEVLQKSSAVAVLPTFGSDEHAAASAAQARAAYADARFMDSPPACSIANL